MAVSVARLSEAAVALIASEWLEILVAAHVVPHVRYLPSGFVTSATH